jgi:REP element-mobilizing transposase RayT
LPGHDYSQPGVYFLTICAHNRRSLFGVVQGPTIKLNAIGKIVDECWREIPDHFPNVGLRIHVVMPNHVHGLLAIQNRLTGETASQPVDGQPRRLGAHAAGSIPAIVRSFKAIVARRVREARFRLAPPIWQRGFYEHVIRTEKEFQEVWKYIRFNPVKWNFDRENPGARETREEGVLHASGKLR